MKSIVFGLYPWLFAALELAVLLIAFEGGFRLGRRGARAAIDGSQMTTVQAAILGFLALILGFSFSIAQGRFDTRRRLVVEEANAIETTYLRAQMLPPPYRARASSLLRKYALERTPPPEQEAIEQALTRSEHLQHELWAAAQAVTRVVEDPAMVLLFVEALNEMIDLHTVRVAAFLYSAPPGLLLLLCAVAALALAVGGYAMGISGSRNLVLMGALSLFVALIFGLLLDLEHPSRGIFKGSRHALVQMQTNIGAR